MTVLAAFRRFHGAFAWSILVLFWAAGCFLTWMPLNLRAVEVSNVLEPTGGHAGWEEFAAAAGSVAPLLFSNAPEPGEWRAAPTVPTSPAGEETDPSSGDPLSEEEELQARMACPWRPPGSYSLHASLPADGYRWAAWGSPCLRQTLEPPERLLH